MSASFALLPTEVLLTILDILTQQITGPVTGYDAAWVNPLKIKWSNNPFEIPVINEQDPRHLDISNLQQVNRRLHELCTPFVYQELSLMKRGSSHEKLITERLPNYAQYIRTIRFYLYHMSTPDEPESHPSHETYISEILSLCTQATSISIYYHPFNAVKVPKDRSFEFCGKIFDIITRADRAPLKSFGLYCPRLLTSGSYTSEDDHIELFLDQLNSSSYLQNHLQNLDLVIQHLPSYKKTTFPSLTSVSFRHSWHSMSMANWSMYQISEWAGQTKLVRLQFINCTNVYAWDIQECVRACPSLQHLLVSACGGAYEETGPPPRTPGWSKEHGALNKHHAPLLSFHIEHMSGTEIIALGVIPTSHLTIGSVYGADFATSVDNDPELFPGLKNLSLPNTNDQFRERDKQKFENQIDSVEKFCEKRGVSLDYEAQCFANRAS
ncbi:hypothetical protein CPB86DRAFT_821922 [Serendipita vermifera]|nr:hypothetical protein CPB86DRAFT_821922 [Serendipita vermifera]